jgi:hypothetical protein
MRPRTCLLSGFTLSAAMFFGITANAGDLPKEGTYSGTYSAFGTIKATPIGKERLLAVADENGVTVGNALMDHTTWHCFGLVDITRGMAQHHGYCVGTDPAGDQLVGDFASDGKYPQDAKSYSGSVTWTTGTGKYAGISGGHKYVCHSPDLRPAAEGTFYQYCEEQGGSYKLQPLTQ